jgi:hypothetical protein
MLLIAFHAIECVLRMAFAVAEQDVAATVQMGSVEDARLDLTFSRSVSCMWGIRTVALACLEAVQRSLQRNFSTMSIRDLSWRFTCSSLVKVRSHMLHCLSAMAGGCREEV